MESSGPFHVGYRDACRRLRESAPPDFLTVFEHGSLEVEIYRPRERDRQEPHGRDEVYVVAAGSGTFSVHGEVVPFEAGDVLFAPAASPHRFESFTADFAAWVFFYGPEGGEPAAPIVSAALRRVLGSRAAGAVRRVDLGREGEAWSSATVLWTPETGGRTPPPEYARPAVGPPCLQFQFDSGWVGVRCGRAEAGGWVLDEERVRELLTELQAERALATPREPGPGADP